MKSKPKHEYHYSELDRDSAIPLSLNATLPGLRGMRLPFCGKKRVVVVTGVRELWEMVRYFQGTPCELTARQIYEGKQAFQYLKRNRERLLRAKNIMFV